MNSSTVRIDHFLSTHGVCSRRAVGAFLKANNVTVNNERISEPGTRINISDNVLIKGKPVKSVKHVYFMLHKPLEILSTTADEYNRKNVTALISTKERIYPVGRLDKDTTGLLILTNDGQLTNLLTHPRYHVAKLYRLALLGKITNDQIKKKVTIVQTLHKTSYGMLECTIEDCNGYLIAFSERISDTK